MLVSFVSPRLNHLSILATKKICGYDWHVWTHWGMWISWDFCPYIDTFKVNPIILFAARQAFNSNIYGPISFSDNLSHNTCFRRSTFVVNAQFTLRSLVILNNKGTVSRKRCTDLSCCTRALNPIISTAQNNIWVFPSSLFDSHLLFPGCMEEWTTAG